jgi:hypothetical protein
MVRFFALLMKVIFFSETCASGLDLIDIFETDFVKILPEICCA